MTTRISSMCRLPGRQQSYAYPFALSSCSFLVIMLYLASYNECYEFLGVGMQEFKDECVQSSPDEFDWPPADSQASSKRDSTRAQPYISAISARPIGSISDASKLAPIFEQHVQRATCIPCQAVIFVVVVCSRRLA